MKLDFRRIWQITLSVAVLMFIIGMAIDSTDVSRYADRMESLMADGDYEAALKVGSKSDKTDRRLMLLRIKALEHEHLLGECLFKYPVIAPIAPNVQRSWTESSVALQSTFNVQRGGDYALCACLIDKQLDHFVRLLPLYYTIDDKLPRYYREALVQYNHLRSNPCIVYHDDVLDTDYNDMQQLERQYADRTARQVAVFRQYEGTYWYYYEYL